MSKLTLINDSSVTHLKVYNDLYDEEHKLLR